MPAVSLGRAPDTSFVVIENHAFAVRPRHPVAGMILAQAGVWVTRPAVGVRSHAQRVHGFLFVLAISQPAPIGRWWFGNAAALTVTT
jgi:hypothetical protein